MRLSAGCSANGRLLQKADTNNKRKPGGHRDRRLDPVGAWDWRASAHGDSREPAARRHRRRRCAGRRSASLCVQAPRYGARCSTGSRSCSGERPDGERGRNSRSGSVGRACTGRRTAGTPVCEAGPIKGRTLPASSAAVCSRGPACICRRALDAAQRRLLRKRPPAPEGRHQQQAQAWRSSRPTTGSCGGVGLEGIRTRGLPRTGRPERSPQTSTATLCRGDGRPVCVSKLHATGLVARRARGRARESDPAANGGGTAGADLSVGLYWSADSRYACM